MLSVSESVNLATQRATDLADRMFAEAAGETWWEKGLVVLDRLDTQYDVLSEPQRIRLGELRQRINFMTLRESSFATGLLTECLGVASGEGEGDA